MFRVLQYIRFLLRSTNQHGVHSPFVYQLVTRCFYDPTRYSAYAVLKTHRNRLQTSKETLTVTDYGSGSKVFVSNTRKVAAIAKVAGISKKRAKLLFRVSRYFSPERITELGTSLGLSTLPLHLGSPTAQLVTVEGCRATQAFAKKMLTDCLTEEALRHLHFKNKRFREYLAEMPLLPKDADSWHLVYFDGHHDKAETLHYVNTLLPVVTPKTLWIFDDIYWSKGMHEAWQDIINHEKVTVSIDTYFWGMVFFRPEQAKQHFTIRI